MSLSLQLRPRGFPAQEPRPGRGGWSVPTGVGRFGEVPTPPLPPGVSQGGDHAELSQGTREMATEIAAPQHGKLEADRLDAEGVAQSKVKLKRKTEQGVKGGQGSCWVSGWPPGPAALPVHFLGSLLA